MNQSLNQSDLLISNFDPLNNCTQSYKVVDLSYSLVSSGVFTDTQRDHLKQYLEKESDDNFFGLPNYVKDIISEHRHLNSLYQWQNEFLTLSKNIDPQNIIYSLPTSGGKTLVAEIEMIKSLLQKRMSVLFILPFVSIVQEKFSALTPLGLALDFFVEEYAGTKGKYPVPKATFKPSLFVATIEKASIIINSLIEEKRFYELSLVVIDEFHMVGEGRRGAILENTITKIKSQMTKTRIIAMSATLKNLDELANFLDARLYQNEFRPVNLDEYVKYEKDLYRVDRSKIPKVSLTNQNFDYDSVIEKTFIRERTIPPGIYTKQIEAKDPDHIIYLISETLQHISENGKGGSCLVFCPTKQHCESTSKLLGELLKLEITLAGSEDKENILQLRKSLIDELKLDSQNGKICHVLEKTVIKGVAYHHSGLTGEERKVIEDGFRDGILRVICATSTLAAGVNLPARRVIIRKPMIGRNFISWSQYHQMIGRAGRAGYDTLGESIIILNTPEERNKYLQILCMFFLNNLMCNAL